MRRQLLAVPAIWLVWETADTFVTAPRWAWLVAAGGLGIAAQVALDPRNWWLGLGIGGAAAVLELLTDLTIVANDLARVRVLRTAPPVR